jgi:dihydrofolate reductase
MIASIWAQTHEGIIGKGGRIPWHYPGDFKRFKRVTSGGAVIMGRNTFESIGKPLPNRLNIVVSWTAALEGVLVARSIEEALALASERKDVWFIGGSRVYTAAMEHVDVIDVTYVPDEIETSPSAVAAPDIDEEVFAPGEMYDHEDEATLIRRVFVRRTLAEAPYDDASNRRLQELGYLSRRPA